MNDLDIQKKIALFRYSTFSNLITGLDDSRSNNEFFEKASLIERTYVDGKKVFVSSSTIERWYYTYLKHGFDGLLPSHRSDLGKTRKLSDDAILKIKSLISDFPRLNAKAIYHRLISDDDIFFKDVSYSTVNRVFKKLKIESTSDSSRPQMLRYEAKYANDIWCLDSTFGLYLYDGKTKKKLCIIAILDDASRLVTACKIFDSDNTSNLISTYKSAITTYGLPRKLNLDNGKNYRSTAFNLINAKLGVALHYDPIHTPTSKGKIERFFKTLKIQWMASINFHDFKSIDEAQKSLNDYVFKYNNSIHSALSISPLSRYQIDSNNIVIKSPEYIDKAFLLEVDRRATVDSLVSINNTFFQCPPQYSQKKVHIAYNFDLSNVLLIDNNKTFSLFKLDKSSNVDVKRKYRFTEDNV